MHQNQSGFAVMEWMLLLCVILLVGFVGWYVIDSQRVASNSYSNISENSNDTKDANITVSDFYSCQALPGHLATFSGPSTCTYKGKTYQASQTFSVDLIKFFNKIPDAAKTQIESYAKTQFESCWGSGNVPRQPIIALSQSNFVDIGLGCESAHHEYFGMDGSTWSDLGGGQAGANCEMIDEYKVKKTMVTSDDSKDLYTTCYYQDGVRTKRL